MYYTVFPLVAMLLMVPVTHLSPYATVLVSFADGKYEPAIIAAAGGRVIEEFKSMKMLYAAVPQNAVAGLKENPAVEFIESDAQFEIAQADALTSIEYSESWGLIDIGAEPVHKSNYTGSRVKIAVLDTGVDYKHPDLASNYKGGYDFINGDNDPMDDNGHGTHVAGIIAAARNGKGTVGVAPDAEIYAVKVSDKLGKGSFSGLVRGINWAIENDIDIVTMSITGEGGSMSLKKAVNVAYDEHGLILLAAIGNGGSGSVLFPAAYENVIGVGSVTKDGAKSSFSRTGSEVELVAPGSGIKSTWPGGKYRLSSGTSMATPFVTGAIALLLGSDELAWSSTEMVDGDGSWTNDEVRQVLRSTAKDLGEEGRDDSFGYGLLNLHFPESRPTSAASKAAEPDVVPADGPHVKYSWFRLALFFYAN